MTRVKIKQVDTFTNVPHTGNPAGAVLDGKELTERQMLSIAREMNLSEAGFVLPPTKRETDLRIRWFSPKGEIIPYGHSAIACVHALAEEGRLGMSRNGRYSLKLESTMGLLTVDVSKDDTFSSVMLGMKILPFEKVTHYKVDLFRILDLRTADFESRFPITRSDYLFVAVKRLHSLFGMQPNYLAMAEYLEQRNLRGICVFTTETIDRESIVHSRFFAPHVGVNEDPVTATVQAQLSVCLFENGLLDLHDGRCVYQGEQGDAIGRRGRVTVELNVDEQKPVSVKVGGSAITVLEGEMIVHE